MLKLFISLLLFSSLSLPLFARECQVYGISDSPQSLDCFFGKEKLPLRCQDGTYMLGTSQVTTAFHYDVERGPIPLVFKTREKELIIYMWQKGDLKAQLFSKGQSRRGFCL